VNVEQRTPNCVVASLRVDRVAGIAVALAWVVLVAGGASAQSMPATDDPTTPVTLPPALDRVLRDYETAWRAGDGTAMAALFTEDGYAIQSGRPIVRGRDAIARTVTKPGGALQLVPYSYSSDGRVGFIVGGFRYPETKGPGGRFVLALRMGDDGGWLIAADLDNAAAR
jgi:ketosteroid isomerase-like protein